MAIPPVNTLLFFQTCVPEILLSLITLSATWPPYCLPNVPCSMLIWNRQKPFSLLERPPFICSSCFWTLPFSCQPCRAVLHPLWCCLSPPSVTSISLAVAVTSWCKDTPHYTRNLKNPSMQSTHTSISCTCHSVQLGSMVSHSGEPMNQWLHMLKCL